ncbi:hypothetical protein [Streptomyces melanogenes]|uniref:hypothetical protein n=1 Tax=Streptomyces melanogenes TaxID=67326 RepID=UPI0019BF2506|nr:hypothetical protein [Streptomyces melanogenes]GGP80050.1 hypothetical protein GCM10010278_68100 [Streptomyces melanogenes]
MIPNRPAAYRKLSAKLAESVRAGDGPELVDLTRHIHVAPSWPDAGRALADLADTFRLDRTREQPVALYLCSEKDTLRVLFEEWVGELGIPVLVSRGYGSESYLRTVRERALAEQRPRILAYVGDADASGEDCMRDFIERTRCWDHIEHLALTVGQARTRGLLAAVGKVADPRWPAFARRHDLDPGHAVQWEAEALDPAELHGLVLDVVDRYLDRDTLTAVLAEELRQRRELEAFRRAWAERRS